MANACLQQSKLAMRDPLGNNSFSGREDGVLNIYDDGIVPPTVDFRIIEPDAAEPYMKDKLEAYIPPFY